MTTPNGDPGNGLEFALSDIREGAVVVSDQLEAAINPIQELIRHISRKASLSSGEQKMPRRIARSAGRVATEILLSEPILPFPPEEDAVTSGYDAAVENVLRKSEKIFEVLSGNSSSGLGPLAERALSFNAGQDVAYYAGSYEALAAYLDFPTTVANIMGMTDLEIPSLRAPMEDYSEAILEFIKALVDRRGGFVANYMLESNFQLIERAFEQARSPEN